MLARAAEQRSALGRQPLLDALVEGIRVSIAERRGRLELLAGGEGDGRSYLLRAAWDQLADTADAVAVFLPEDAPSGSLLHLLSLVLEGLPEEAGRPAPAELVAQLRRGRRAPTVERALGLLDERLGGRALLLFIDGLDEALEGLGGKEQRRLSQLLVSRCWVVVAAGAGSTGALGASSAAFETGLHVRRLPPLSVEDARTLLLRSARQRHRPTLADYLESSRGREEVRLWHRVLGGNPGCLVQLEPFLESGRPAWESLTALAEHTRSDQAAAVARLSPGQRAVLASLGRHARPLTVGELASRTFNSHQTTSSHLRYLSKAGWVHALTVGRERYYEVSDPLIRECWAARRREQRQQAGLGILGVEAALQGDTLPRLDRTWVRSLPVRDADLPVVSPDGPDPIVGRQQLEAAVLHGANLGTAELAWARRSCRSGLEGEHGAACARALLLDGGSPVSVLHRAGQVLFEGVNAELLEDLLPVLLERGELREAVALGDRVPWSKLGAMDRLAWVQAACRTGDQRRAQGRVVDIVAGVDDLAQRRWMLAAGYLAVGEYTSALREAELGRDAFPGQGVFPRLAARAAWALGDLDRAGRHAENAVRGEDVEAEDWMLLGAVCQGQGAHRRAVVALERVVAHPDWGTLARQLLWPELVQVGALERARVVGSDLGGVLRLLSGDLIDLLEGGAGRGLGSRPPRPEDLPAPVAGVWFRSWFAALLRSWRGGPAVLVAELGKAFSGPFQPEWAAWWGWLLAEAAAFDADRSALVGIKEWLEQVLELPEEVQLTAALLALPEDPRPFARLSSMERQLARRLLERAGPAARARQARLPREPSS